MPIKKEFICDQEGCNEKLEFQYENDAFCNGWHKYTMYFQGDETVVISCPTHSKEINKQMADARQSSRDD